MNLAGPEIYEKMHQGVFGQLLGSINITSAEGAAKESSTAHSDLEGTLLQFQDRMSNAWKGKASESAHESLKPMYRRTQRASEGMTRTEGSLRGQADSFTRTRDNLVEMTQGRDEYSAEVDDATMGLIDAEMAKAIWDEKNRHNIHQYQKYKESAESYQEQLVKDFSADESSGDGGNGGSGDSGSDSTGKEWVPGPGTRTAGGPNGPGGPSGPGGWGGPTGGGPSSSGSGGSGTESGSRIPGPSSEIHSDGTSSSGLDSPSGTGTSSGPRGNYGSFSPGVPNSTVGNGGSHGSGPGTSGGGSGGGGVAPIGGGAVRGGAGGGGTGGVGSGTGG